MRSHILLFLMFAISGCATRVFEVHLTPPQVATPGEVVVKDARLDPQVYMTGISIGSQANIYLLAPEPPLDASLRSFIQSKLSTRANISVSIERLDIKNKVGFAKADELYCELESSITVSNRPNRILVRTFSKNTENMSPLVTTSAKVILRQCLEQHATEIVEHLSVEKNEG